MLFGVRRANVPRNAQKSRRRESFEQLPPEDLCFFQVLLFDLERAAGREGWAVSRPQLARADLVRTFLGAVTAVQVRVFE